MAIIGKCLTEPVASQSPIPLGGASDLEPRVTPVPLSVLHLCGRAVRRLDSGRILSAEDLDLPGKTQSWGKRHYFQDESELMKAGCADQRQALREMKLTGRAV